MATNGSNGSPNEPFRVVGIGASAGGLEALEEFFKNIPDDTNLAFVVVQHLSPDYKSLMVELLSKYTRMREIPVLLLTGHSRGELDADSFPQNIVEIITKPIDKDSLCKTVNRYTELDRGAEA